MSFLGRPGFVCRGRLRGVLGASWRRLGAQDVLEVLRKSTSMLEAPWRRPGDTPEATCGPLGASWVCAGGVFGASSRRLGGVLEASLTSRLLKYLADLSKIQKT